jgi:hypothetical protein
MKRRALRTGRLLVLTSTAVLLAALVGPAIPQESGSNGLRKVEPPTGSEPREEALARVFSREFDAEEWRRLLGTTDLDRREQNLDDLLTRARVDPLARAFLEELARAGEHPDLAWTARLALRELGRAPQAFSPLSPLFGGLGGGMGGLAGDPFQLRNQMEEMLRDLWSEHGGMGFFIRPPQVPGAADTPRSSQRSVEVTQDKDGARVVIKELVDGQEQRREYQDSSLEALLEKNPELCRELEGGGVFLGPSPGELDLRFDLGQRAGPGRWSFPFRQLGQPPAGQTAPLQRSRPVRMDVLGVMVRPVSPERAQELGLADGLGLTVRDAYPGTYAHLLGVRAGDVLLELDGVELRDADDIGRVMGARPSDQDLTLVWIDQLGQRQSRTWRAAEKR